MLSMPHAVAFDRPFDNLTHRSKSNQLMLPLPKSSSIPSFVPSGQYTRLQVASALPTPPTTMSLVNGSTLPPFPQANLTTPLDPTWNTRRNNAFTSLGNNTANTTDQGYHTTQEMPHMSSSQNSPSQRSSCTVTAESARRKASNATISPQFQIPDTINTPQAGMPQLAAEITCLFWFENSSTLNEVLRPTSPRKKPNALVPEALPSTGFRKWVATILSTTQVTQNVILLALLFVYRLKKTNPTVRGKVGSEYRLLTVALMLGNKFLDDNTYTNKTWAEVSGISVQEVHIMEVEFLSNMRYSLYTSLEQWNEWHMILGKFGTYFDRASRVNMEMASRLGAPAPTYHNPLALPSPPVSNRASPPFSTTSTPNYGMHNSTPLLLPQVNSTAVSPIGPLPEQDYRPNGRKRSLDDSPQGPPPKRPTHQQFQHSAHPVGPQTQLTTPTPATTLPRLPNLSIPLSQPPQQPAQIPHLPPPGNRAMSLVYPPPQWSQSQSTPSSSATTGPTLPQIQSHNGSTYEQSRQLSPYPNSAAGSPSAVTFPNQSRLSPSYLLQQRQSPYRPVRNVQTLLYPPPSASMHTLSRNISYDQMQYQPLGRPVEERRAGPLPYMHHEAWPESHQYNQLPVLPQPNFSR